MRSKRRSQTRVDGALAARLPRGPERELSARRARRIFYGTMNVLIAGAGIGGLTLAAGLQQLGVRVQVLERAPVLKPVGAGLVVQINAMRALAEFGLDAAVKQAGAVAAQTALLDWRGRVLTASSLTPWVEKFGQPVVCALRSRLHDALGSHVAPGTVELGQAVKAYAEDDDGVTVTLESGRTLRADLLVGADGLHSRVRAQLLGEQPTRYSGYTSWRGVCSAAGLALADTVSESWGEGRRFGLVPVGFDEVYWFATANAPPGGKDSAQPDELLARYGDWHAPIPQVLRGTPAERLIRTDISDRPPVTRWTSKRVALLGDAAHPMTPNLGQGACQAIEDAVVLAKLLGAGADVAASLERYEQRRVPRANAVVEQAHRLGAVGQWENGLARTVRDGAMRVFGERLGRSGLDALYGFEPSGA